MRTSASLGVFSVIAMAWSVLAGCQSEADPPPKEQAVWSVVGQAGFSSNTPVAMDIAIDPSGMPYVAFMNSASYASRVMRYSGSAWADVVSLPLDSSYTPGLSHDRGSSYSLAFDSKGVAYVAYYAYSFDGLNNNPVAFYVYKHSDSNWSQIGSVGVVPARIGKVALRIGQDDIPYLAVISRDGAGSGFAQALSYDGLVWNPLHADRFTFIGGASAVTFDPAFRPYFAYGDLEDPSYTHVVRGDSESWSTVGGDLPEADIVSYYSTPIAFDPSGVPYIAFSDFYSGHLSVMKYAGSAWTSVGPAEISSTGADNICMEFDPSGTPYVLYRAHGVGGGDRAYLLKFNGSDWVFVGGAAVSPGFCDWLSLALDSRGDPYVAFMDRTAGDRATVMTIQ